MFWCITCDGYSSRGMKLVVVGNTNDAAVTALQLTRFTDDVTIITNQRENAIGEEAQARLAEAGVLLIHDTIKTAHGTNGQLESLTTSGGLTIKLDRLFNQQGARPASSSRSTSACSLTRTATSAWTASKRPTSPVCTRRATSMVCTRTRSRPPYEGGQAAWRRTTTCTRLR